MTVRIILATAFLSAGSHAMYVGKQSGPATSQEVKGLIVSLKTDVAFKVGKDADGNILTGQPEMDRLNTAWRVRRVDRIVRAGHGDTGHPLSRYFVIEAEGSPDYERMKSECQRSGLFETVELDYVFEFFSIPNDPLFPYQFNFYNTGQLHPVVVKVAGDFNDYVDWVSGMIGADMGAFETLFSPPDNTRPVVVAVIDSGIDLDHPDLGGRIWTNSLEIDGNGIDDDHNGYIDDVIGWDFNGAYSDNDPTDELGHGSHCAGIIAGVTNNGAGIAGVCPDVKLMALRISLRTSDNVAAIVYAADNGADVINMSWGGSASAASVALEDALIYAKARGVILCAASGNVGAEIVNYPAYYNSVISVGASTDQDLVADFSSYNIRHDIVAPGVDILSLRADDLDLYGTESNEPGVHIIDDHYYLMSGTSMACPAVAGAAAYMRAVSPGISPDMTEGTLKRSAKDIVDPFGWGWSLPGWDKYSGSGRLNLGGALQVTRTTAVEITSPTRNQMISGSTVDIIGTANAHDVTIYHIDIGEGWNPTEWTRIGVFTSGVIDGTLGTWDIESLAGRYTIRVSMWHGNYDMVTVFIGEETTAEITSPREGESLSGRTNVIGTVSGATLSKWVLDYRQAGSVEWVELVASGKPARDELLYTWPAGLLGEGNYILRLSTYSTAGLEARDEVNVYNPPARQPDWLVDLGGWVDLAPTYGDFDGDGQQELLIGTYDGIKAFNMDGSVKTTGLEPFPLGDFRAPISVGNLDGDGIDDFVALRFDQPSIYCFISSDYHFNLPISYIYLPPSGPIVEYYRNYVVLCDTDGDGEDELFLHSYAAGKSYVIAIDLGTGVTKVLPGMRDFVPADLNNDMMKELYYAYQPTAEIQIRTFNGTILKSYAMGEEMADGVNFNFIGMSAYDIDTDGKLELIVSGYPTYVDGDAGSYFYADAVIYAFDEGLVLKDGWPRHTGIEALYPSHPVFGDIDGDGSLEYVCTWFEAEAGCVKAWNIDGSSHNFNGGDHLKVDSAVFFPPLLADIDNDHRADIVVSSSGSFFQRSTNGIYAWNSEGDLLPGYPFSYRGEPYSATFYIESVVGDLDSDGDVDLVAPLINNTLGFFDFDAAFDGCVFPVTSWRYNRALTGVGPSFDTDGSCCCSNMGKFYHGDEPFSILDIDDFLAYLFMGGNKYECYMQVDVGGPDSQPGNLLNPGIHVPDNLITVLDLNDMCGYFYRDEFEDLGQCP